MNFKYKFIQFFLIFTMSSCAMVSVNQIESQKYIAMKRNDVLTTGKISQVTQEELIKSSQEISVCEKNIPLCIKNLENSTLPLTDRKISALSEIWLYQAMKLGKKPQKKEERLIAFLESSKYAYAYLFLGDYNSKDRIFTDRQTQVRDYYTYSIQTIISDTYPKFRQQNLSNQTNNLIKIGDWTINVDTSKTISPQNNFNPERLIPASSLTFKGLRSSYRRDGFGAEFVAVFPKKNLDNYALPFKEMSTPIITGIIKFNGNNLEELFTTNYADLILLDPYQNTSIKILNEKIPLAANYTSGYGFWLANSNFASQSFETLFFKTGGIYKSFIFLMQPYDPNKRIILMIHGLASSPEAWVNLANELIGDQKIRDNFQIWNIYYPTNIPIFVNYNSVKEALKTTLNHFDPNRKNIASHNIILIGHSMGGIISRLLISNAKTEMLDLFINQYHLNKKTINNKTKKILSFSAQPEFTRAIFLATPHKGTDIAENKFGRFVAGLVKVPITAIVGAGTVIEDIFYTLGIIKDSVIDNQIVTIPNSIDNLSKNDPFIKTSSQLPIAPNVIYHSIIAIRDPSVPLEKSNDGLVPYWSSHLAGAKSEKIIHSWHSVQEKSEAISEIIRIIYEDLAIK